MKSFMFPVEVGSLLDPKNQLTPISNNSRKTAIHQFRVIEKTSHPHK